MLAKSSWCPTSTSGSWWWDHIHISSPTFSNSKLLRKTIHCSESLDGTTRNPGGDLKKGAMIEQRLMEVAISIYLDVQSCDKSGQESPVGCCIGVVAPAVFEKAQVVSPKPEMDRDNPKAIAIFWNIWVAKKRLLTDMCSFVFSPKSQSQSPQGACPKPRLSESFLAGHFGHCPQTRRRLLDNALP